ncbi:MAG: cation transporter [Acidobacteria bacterium]|nr:MAG: cation transporter [Acidobacteriota bacterium]REJ99353.1 MAG: cation transporter [Acidobacteriota bacterium]REK16267.1 MAG: cation transporter [Acidobacteriota bacterium]REK43948.1 MAG: cation transporter [Acidobacteriota bacterium]
MIAEAVGGWITNSLALLADAGHMLTDVASLSLTLAAIWFAERPATPNKTYGYYRLEILAAFINGVALAAISIWVIYEAYSRWLDPPEVLGAGLTAVAIGGLIVNLLAAWLLHGDHKHDLNLRGAWLHVIGDALGSVAAIVAGAAILIFGWVWADAAASVLISVIIIYGAWKLIKDSVNVLLEGTPSHINLTAVEDSLRSVSGITDVHDLHVWTITSGIEALSVHVVHDGSGDRNQCLVTVRERMLSDFGIEHLTVQIENEIQGSTAEHPCFSGTNCFGPIHDGKHPRTSIGVE